MLSEGPVDVVSGTLMEGAAGTRQTLNAMARMVKAGRILQVVMETARERIGHVAPKNYTAEADTLFRFVRDEVRYTKDVNDVETLQTPDYTLMTRHGDCDDKAILLAALLEAVGHRCRFIAVGYTAPGAFEHVYLETLMGHNNWVACDPTMPVPFGWAPVPPDGDFLVKAKMVGFI